jgi:hypothetical protein
MKVSCQLSYSVLKAFRFAGRAYEHGDVFNARRADPRMGRLRQWCADGVLGPLGEEPEPQPDPEGEQEADDESQKDESEAESESSDPEGEQLEDLPQDGEDFEE